ncbi:MAG: Ig-like domain-containing protein, partial [Clostridia bacterium]|nr:Ig-like domain-containing protein [Clostridia bacterium]
TTVKITAASASNPAAPTATCTVTIKQGVVASQISLNKYGASLAIGGTTQLTATILPTNATTKTVTWTSSDPTIATVSSTGKITAVKAGTCIVTATSNGSGEADLSAQCTVTVSAVSSGSIGLNALNLTLYHDQSATLVATVYPSNATNKEVTFSSSNSRVATVDASSGLITAVGNGRATITVTANDGSGATASCLVSVMDKVDVTRITLNMSDFSLLLNDTTVLTATVYPEYSSVTDVTWSSSSPNAVSVDENGKITGLVAGQSATITATAKDGSGVSASVTVDVVTTFYGNGRVVNCLRRVNVRAQPSGQSTHRGYAYLNETYKVLGKTGNWYKIRYKDQTCYIWAAYIRLIGDGTAEYTSAGTASTGTGTTGTTTPTKATITNCVYAVNVRSGPGTNYDKLGIAPVNETYTYLGTYGDWYKVQYNTTTEAYIHSQYIFLS